MLTKKKKEKLVWCLKTKKSLNTATKQKNGKLSEKIIRKKRNCNTFQKFYTFLMKIYGLSLSFSFLLELHYFKKGKRKIKKVILQLRLLNNLCSQIQSKESISALSSIWFNEIEWIYAQILNLCFCPLLGKQTIKLC